MKLSLTIPARLLTAARLFTSNDETRYVLCGAYVETSEKQTLIVSTNGRSLLVINATSEVTGQSGEGNFIIPNSLLSGLPKPEHGGSLKVDYDAKEWVYIEGQRCISAPSVDGEYPNWRKVIPSDKPKPMAQVQIGAGLFDSVRKVATLLGGNGDGYIMRQHGGEAAPYVLKPCFPKPDWMAIIMPLRGDTSEELPSWIK